jgi:hypothetical protein
MLKMGGLKRKISYLLVFTLLFNLMASVAWATPWKKVPPGQAKKAKAQKVCLLIDIPGHWAEEAMTKMNMRRVINGYEDSTFQPNKPITHAEAIVMLVRLLGLEDEAEQASTNKLKNSKKIPDWARGYVAVAYERGILTEKDLANFQPNKPAKRYEIAVLALRAFDNSELEEQITDLNFIDADEIPAWAKAYVQQMFILKLMIGNPDRSFQPNKPITRAEMSVLLDKMEKLFPGKNKATDDEENQDIEGVLTKIRVEDKNTGTLTIKKENGKSITVDVTKESIIFVNKKRAELKQLKVNSNVEVIIDPNGVVLFIRSDKATDTQPVEEDEKIEGTLESIVTVNNVTSITLKVDGINITYDLTEDVTIRLNGKSATIEHLKPGQEIEATVVNDKVVALEVDSYITTVTGELTTVMLNGSTGKKQIEVKVGATLYTYEVDKNAVIKQDGETVAFTELQTGSTVELEISDGIVVEVISESTAS